MTVPPLPPSRLAVFATDPDTGNPVSRLPLFAELAVPRLLVRAPIDERHREPIRGALLDLDPDMDRAVRDRLEAALLAALAEILPEEERDGILGETTRFRDWVHAAFKAAMRAAGVERPGALAQTGLAARLTHGLREAARDVGLALPAQAESSDLWSEPLGVLTTDHMGYASFDLTRLSATAAAALATAIAARRTDPDAAPGLALWVEPYGGAGRFDALAQGRFARDAIVARFTQAWHTLPPALINMGPRALQNPSLTDWRLSPASFAASPEALLGEDGCELLMPALLPLQEFVLRQVVRLTDRPAGMQVPARFKAAYVDDYKVSWSALGHSLGEILYSLPLAPGETTKLAVIDWSWDSETRRDESTQLDESLLHQTHRDRTIAETVRAGLSELQRGSSFMGGAAGASGATGGANLGVVGVGAAVGNTWSFGGSTATSQGSRDLAADMTQRLSDSFQQASSARRALTSTVVIQARQEEKQSIQTRTFTNYNHSHTLTILYHEVLRHYRVTTEWIRRRPAVLMKTPTPVALFDADTLIAHRMAIEPNLLDRALAGGFDLLQRQEGLRRWMGVQGLAASDAWTEPPWEGDIDLSLFEFGLRTAGGDTDDTDELVMINLILVDGTIVNRPLVRAWEKGAQSDDVNVGDRLNYNNEWGWFIAKPDVPVKWKMLAGFEFVLHDNDEWRMSGLCINAFHGNGRIALIDMTDVNYWFPLNGSSQTVTWIRRPMPKPAALPPAHRAPEKTLTPDEFALTRRLIDHANLHSGYYNRIIRLTADPNAIAIALEGEAWDGGGTAADHVEPTPLETFGEYVAYPLATAPAGVDDSLVVAIAAGLASADPGARERAAAALAALAPADRATVEARLPLAQVRAERLISLPTRGVFAEGKLGHCNVSEEIDNTRFWKWEEHPIPFEAPGIEPATPISPTPQPVNPTPTPFPQSLVNVVAPSAAPDPMGLTAALQLLGTPNIFRDMSGRQEVADLLKKLSDNSVSIAEAANRAREIQAKYGVDLDRQAREEALGVYKAAAEVEGKAIEAEAQRAAKADAATKEATAKKAEIDAANAQAEASKNVPKGLRAPIQQAAAQAMAGNPIKSKVIVFKAVGYNGQVLEGEFGLAVRDVTGQKDLIAEPKVGAYFDKPVSFSVPDPVVEARARRIGTAQIRILDEVIQLAPIDVVPGGKSYVVGKSHKVINVTLKQAGREVSFKAKSTNGAVDELMNKWGAELGVNKVVAAKLVSEYEKKHQITHATEEEKSYTFTVPTQTYSLEVTSF